MQKERSNLTELRKIRHSIRERFANAENQFVRQSPQLDADLLLCHVLGVTRTWLFLHDDVVLTEAQEVAVMDAVEKRLSGLPVAYITGVKEFYGRTFAVTPDVLIPKPDTELLVEKAVSYAKSKITERMSGASLGVGRQFRFADICTGSGCIAVSVIAELFAEFGSHIFDSGDSANYGLAESSGQGGTDALGKADAFGRALADAKLEFIHADATDISAAALSVARKNAEFLLGGAALRSLRFFEGDLCRPLMAGGSSKSAPCGGDCAARSGVPQSAGGGTFVCMSSASDGKSCPKYDMVLSNPPYVPADVTDELLKDGRGEPRLALDGDTDTALGGELARGGSVCATDGVRCDSPDGETSSEKSSDGLAIIRRLILQVKEILLPGGVFFMETGEYNAEKAAEYLSKCGFTDIVIHRDLAGQLRLVESHI